MSESGLCCPGCGAPASPDAAACEYCGRPLVTVTCPSCFAAMFVGSRYCWQCGAEATRDANADARPLRCPRCRQEEMQSLQLGTTAVHECGACGGLWLDPLALQQLVDKREEHTGVIQALNEVVPPSAVAFDVVKYLPCPMCAKLMNRENFARTSGVIVDLCRHHGVWLDRGELHRVMEFVAAGGMTAARQLGSDQDGRVDVKRWFVGLSKSG